MTAEAKPVPTRQFLTDEAGNKTAVVIPIDEYEALIEKLEDLEDIRLYDEAKANDDGTRIPLEDILEELKRDGKLPR